MRKGCRLVRTLFLLIFCFSLVADSSPSPAFSKSSGSNARRAEVNGVSSLPKSDDVDDNSENADYCMKRATDRKGEPSYNFAPNTLNSRHTRVKRVAMQEEEEEVADDSDSVKKRSLAEFRDKFSYSGESGPQALALSSKESSKYTDTMQNSRANGDYAEKYADQDLSRMYDDLEAKDIVKRDAVLGGEYEEDNEDDEDDLSDNPLEDTAPVEDNGNADSRSESRAKRDQSNWEESKGEYSSNAESKDSKRVEGELAKIDEPNSLEAGEVDLEEKSRNLMEKVGHSKRSAAFSDRTGLEDDTDPNSPKDAKVYEAELRETRGESEKRLDGSIASETSKRDTDLYGDYERRAELEIQRKVDAIKAEIKREIEQNQRLREIEENNAKFDQLRIEDDDAVDDDFEDAKVEKRQAAKRMTPQHLKRLVRSHDRIKFNKRSLGKKARRKETASRKVGSRKARVGKGSAGGRKPAMNRKVSKASASPVKKREYVRQVILVKNAADTRKRRRSSADIIERNAEGGVPLSTVVEALGKETNEKKHRFAPDYNEAFGGLQTDPRGSLARYKRIKRHLRVPT